MKLFKHKIDGPIVVNSWEDVTKFCADRYSVQPYQVKTYYTNATDKYLVDPTADVILGVALTNKTGETFAVVGYINFDPNK